MWLHQWYHCGVVDVTPQANLRHVYEQYERLIISQMFVRFEALMRATRFIGYCVLAATVIAAGGLYEFCHAGRPAVLIITLIATVQVLGAACVVTIPERVILPGRLPSDIWERLTQTDMTEVAFITSLFDESRRQIVQNEIITELSNKALRWATYCALTTVPTALLAAWLISA